MDDWWCTDKWMGDLETIGWRNDVSLVYFMVRPVRLISELVAFQVISPQNRPCLITKVVLFSKIYGMYYFNLYHKVQASPTNYLGQQVTCDELTVWFKGVSLSLSADSKVSEDFAWFGIGGMGCSAWEWEVGWGWLWLWVKLEMSVWKAYEYIVSIKAFQLRMILQRTDENAKVDACEWNLVWVTETL